MTVSYLSFFFFFFRLPLLSVHVQLSLLVQQQKQASLIAPLRQATPFFDYHFSVNILYPINQCLCVRILRILPQQSIFFNYTMFSHNPIFALFSSVAIQREQRKNQEQENIYKDLSVRSCAESVCVCVHSVRVWNVRVTSIIVHVSTNF